MQTISQYPTQYLVNEAYSLLARLAQIKPFSMTMPMVKGASVSDKALKEITLLLEKGKGDLKHNIFKFIEKIKDTGSQNGYAEAMQSDFTILKLRFNSILDQLDIFADVLSQRSEYEVGIWTSGLDVLAEDGLTVLKKISETPALIVYLDRGHGAAIRRARTRLPGGDLNPVGVIQIPRERMVGSGIASSLIHEVGHQAAAILDLVATLKQRIARKKIQDPDNIAWKYFDRCISEIVADVWSTGHLGVAATLGLMGVVTLPRYFQFRLDLNDPHPAPYVRVMLSCAFGKRLFPHQQWDKLSGLWKKFYPVQGLPEEMIRILKEIENEMPAFVDFVLDHSTKEMKGRKLFQLFPVQERQPAILQQRFQQWRKKEKGFYNMPPTLVFAILGQAKADLLIDAAEENNILTRLLRYWAFSRN